MFESEKVEFKVQATDDLYKEVIAFANTDGGVIYVGIDNQGNIVGLEDVDETYLRITNGIRDAIQPDVTMFVRYTLQDNQVVKVSVSEGSFKPYYLKAKGLKPSGVYVRQGTSSVQASPEQIRRMIKESDGDCFESMRSVDQNLTFQTARQAFTRYGVSFSEEKYRVLGMKDTTDSLYTNLAALLSDQCAHTIKVAVYKDASKAEFIDRKEFSGSVFDQLDRTFDYLKLCNKTHAVIQGLERVDTPDYPEEALREALLNAIVHRDYSFSGSIIINVNQQEIEFISLGGLLPGLSPEDIRSGISQPRNEKLAEVFYRLRLIESYGTGICKIYGYYKQHSTQPRIQVTPNTFKIILPNMNFTHVPEKPVPNMTAQMEELMEFIDTHGEVSEGDVQDLFNVRSTRAYVLMRQMRDAGLVKVKGRGPDKKYVKR